MSQQIGLWLLILGLAALPLLWRYRPPQRGALIGFVAAAILAILGAQAISRPLWDALSPLALIQFPFRLLALVDLFLALTAAGVIAALLPRTGVSTTANRVTPPVLVALGLAIILASYPYTRPEHTSITARNQSPNAVVDFEVAYPDMRGSTAFAGTPPTVSPKLEAYLADEPLPLAGILTGEGRVEALRHGAGSEQIRVTAQTPVTVQFYTYWYPGWRAGRAPGRR